MSIQGIVRRVMIAIALATSASMGALAPLAAQEASATRSLETRLASIEKSIDAMRREAGVPGVALAVVKDGKVVLIKGLGQRDVAKGEPVTPETLFAIGSVSKTFTALAIMMAVEERRLSLDDAPKKWLPAFKLADPDADAKVTLRDLLSHRTGLERADLAWIIASPSRDELIGSIATLKQVAKLGSSFNYNNYLYVASGEVLARARGERYEDIVTSRILRPLGMRSTTFSAAEMEKAADHAVGYTADPKSPAVTKMLDTTVIAAAGGLASNARDMAELVRFILADGVHDGRRLVTQASLREMSRRQVTIAGNVGYGLGFFLRSWQGRQVIEHGGNVFGFSALVAMIPSERIGFVMLTNASNSPIAEAAAMEAVWSALIDTPATAKSAPAAEKSAAPEPAVAPEKEVGIYASTEDKGDFEVTLEGGRLRLKVPGQPAYLLEPLGGRRYKLGSPAPGGFVATFRPGTHDPALVELFLVQPHGNIILPKRAPAPLEPSYAALAGLVGPYVDRSGGRVEIASLAGKVVLLAPWQPAYPLTSRGSGVYGLTGLTPADKWAVVERRNADNSLAGITLKQPNGDFAFDFAGTRQATITIDELRRRALEAQGKDAVLRSRTSLTLEVEGEIDGSGVRFKGSQTHRLPAAYAGSVQLLALDKALKRITVVFDGTAGHVAVEGEPRREMKPEEIDGSLLEGTLLEELDWDRLYTKVEVAGQRRFAGQDAFIVRKTMKSGRVVTDYYATRTFLLIGRELMKWSQDAGKEVAASYVWSKHRAIDGVVIPFEVAEKLGELAVTTRITSAKWNLPIDERIFARN